MFHPMKAIFGVIQLLALVEYLQCSLDTTRLHYQKCSFNRKTFWKIYERHFEITNAITIRIIESRHMSPFYIDAIMTRFFKNTNLNNSVHVKYVYFDKPDEHYVFPEEIYPTGNDKQSDKHKAVHGKVMSDKDLVRVKRQTSDIQNGNVIIVWNEDVLYNILRDNKDIVIGNTRSLYSIVFLAYLRRSETQWRRKIGAILKLLWEKYDVLNVSAQFACSVIGNEIYIFYPFMQNHDKSWGSVRKFRQKVVRNDEYLLYNRLGNLHGYTLNATIFHRRPTAMSSLPKQMRWNPLYSNLSTSGGYGGQDGMLLANLAAYLNFKINAVQPTDDENFGNDYLNGTITGSLGDVAFHRSHLAANGRFYFRTMMTKFEYTKGYSCDRICIVVPKSGKVPTGLTMFNCFTPFSWIIIVFLTLIVMAVINIIQGARNKFSSHNEKINGYMITFSILVAAPVNISELRGHRILLTTWMLFSMILTNAFQGRLFKSFSSVTYYKDIDTFDELDRSGIPVATSLGILFNGTTEVIQKLGKKRIDIHGNALRYTAQYRNICAIEREGDGKLFISAVFVADDGSPKLHMMNECPVSYFLALVVPHGSPYLLKFNSVIQMFLENGLINKWYRDTIEGIKREKQGLFRSHDDVFYALELSYFAFIFYALIIGLFFASFVFFVEVTGSQT